MTTQRTDVYTQVTDNIIAAIEAGAGQWQMPWHRSGEGLNRPVNIDTSNAYRGINVINLWVSAQVRGFTTGTWGTYRQWQNKGCQVRKGEKSSLVVFYKEFDVEDQKDDGETEHGKRLMARASWVFNADQVDGYEASAIPEPTDPVKSIDKAERFVSATGAVVRHGGDRAFYRPSEDIIQMPDRERFLGSETSTATEAYWSTLLHELTHWSGASNRCDRQFGKRFGDDAYAMEELVAELGAAFLCADLGVTLEPRPDHAAYLDNWLKVLKADKKAIFTAASQAARASDYLTGLQPAGITEAAA
ncbi:ArdC family protein [Thalassospira marina]|uniref:Peptidase n=1 Tax=Thalassospira marina TaxID=2048283 RepID=A0A2N3KD82_9PROT|nr:zincin-like metallopeptidase domain-containing protein [Thalassospira marina]PKR48456.1 peptidase [Thalassospira marina]